jgi:Mg-chelatase subunit ChlD
MLKKALIFIFLSVLSYSCGHIGGDVEEGISACGPVDGQGTWVEKFYQGQAMDSKNPVTSLSILGGVAQNFSSQNGGQIKLNVQLKDKNNALIFNDLKIDDFELSGQLQLQSTSAFVNLTAEVDEAKLNSIEKSSTLVNMASMDTLPGANIVMLYDSSGSTASTDRNRARVDAGKAFVAGLNEAAQVAVLDFGVIEDGSIFETVVSACFKACRLLTDFVSDHALINASIDRVTSSGGTPLYAALNDALSLVQGIQKQGAQRFDLLVFTDGQASDYDKSTADQIIREAKALKLRIHTVALQEDSESSSQENIIDIENLQRLSEQTNGTSLTTTDASSLSKEFEQVAKAASAPSSIYVVIDVKASNIKAGLYNLKGKLKSTANQGNASSDFSITFQVD